MSKKKKPVGKQAWEWLESRGASPLICGTIIILHICKQGINKSNVLIKSFEDLTVAGVVL